MCHVRCVGICRGSWGCRLLCGEGCRGAVARGCCRDFTQGHRGTTLLVMEQEGSQKPHTDPSWPAPELQETPPSRVCLPCAEKAAHQLVQGSRVTDHRPPRAHWKAHSELRCNKENQHQPRAGQTPEQCLGLGKAWLERASVQPAEGEPASSCRREAFGRFEWEIQIRHFKMAFREDESGQPLHGQEACQEGLQPEVSGGEGEDRKVEPRNPPCGGLGVSHQGGRTGCGLESRPGLQGGPALLTLSPGSWSRLAQSLSFRGRTLPA